MDVDYLLRVQNLTKYFSVNTDKIGFKASIIKIPIQRDKNAGIIIILKLDIPADLIAVNSSDRINFMNRITVETNIILYRLYLYSIIWFFGSRGITRSP